MMGVHKMVGRMRIVSKWVILAKQNSLIQSCQTIFSWPKVKIILFVNYKLRPDRGNFKLLIRSIFYSRKHLLSNLQTRGFEYAKKRIKLERNIKFSLLNFMWGCLALNYKLHKK
jgi:hypothetical protein